LYYTDESEDGGKALRKVIADFENTYDVFDFSIDKYFNRITAPIQVHQGTADASVPEMWSTNLVKTLEDKQISVNYYIYPGADHNLRPSWDSAVARSLAFFKEILYGKK
jgi:dipeptidyl aminopeptidase/acylaminoacyl peptidase